jgi:hypothetical protein
VSTPIKSKVFGHQKSQSLSKNISAFPTKEDLNETFAITQSKFISKNSILSYKSTQKNLKMTSNSNSGSFIFY